MQLKKTLITGIFSLALLAPLATIADVPRQAVPAIATTVQLSPDMLGMDAKLFMAKALPPDTNDLKRCKTDYECLLDISDENAIYKMADIGDITNLHYCFDERNGSPKLQCYLGQHTFVVQESEGKMAGALAVAAIENTYGPSKLVGATFVFERNPKFSVLVKLEEKSKTTVLLSIVFMKRGGYPLPMTLDR